MSEVKFFVRYKNKDYEFKYGSEVYIFSTMLYNNVKNVKKILKMTDIIHMAYLEDDNRTPLGTLSDYVAANWKEVKELSSTAILKNFYRDTE